MFRRFDGQRRQRQGAFGLVAQVQVALGDRDTVMPHQLFERVDIQSSLKPKRCVRVPERVPDNAVAVVRDAIVQVERKIGRAHV